MVQRLLLLPFSCAVAVAAFTGEPFVTRRPVSNVAPLHMGGSSKYASSSAGKRATVEKVKGLLETSEMIFSIPASSITVAEVQDLRRSLPEGTTMSVVKNTLMMRAVEGTEYAVATDMLKGANLWFFIEEDIGGTIKAFNTFAKDTGKKDTHEIVGGVIEGTAYDSAGVTAIGELPSKQELYAQIAGAVKAVPTKVARVIKAPSSKLARAIKLATADEDKADS